MTAVQTQNVLAALPPWAAVLVWISAIVGAAIFVYRRITGATRPKPDADEESTDPTAPDATETSAVPSAFFVDPTTDRPGIPLRDSPAAPEAPTGSPADPPAEAPAATADRPAAPAAPVGSSGSSGSSGPEAGTSGSTRAGYFAPSGQEGTGDPSTGVRRLTVAEALRGVDMPCGLSPVIDGSVSIPNPFRVAFLTTTSDAATVGASMGDELERLGYQLTTATATEVLARKPGIELRVVLYPAPAKATRGLDQLFPVAPSGSVGIEFST